MPQKIRWTEAADALLVHLRHHEGASWDRIADALGVSRNAALERGRRLHVLLPERVAHAAVRNERDRPALPPGHPASWGALIAGTL
ncbi:MAG: AsnC family protein, partial [Acetobacteraceae bacterium]